MKPSDIPMQARAPVPIAAALGYLAVLPFVAGAVLPWVVDADLRPATSLALSIYAAVVISFIGAIHWGLGFARVDPAVRLFAWGVVPAIVACPLALTPPRFGLASLAAVLVVCYLVDRVVYPVEGIAAWLPLRLRLTVVAGASCLVGAAGS